MDFVDCTDIWNQINNQMAPKDSNVGRVNTYLSYLTRRKKLPPNLLETNLRRCLSTLDITLLAIGHMVGTGVYVLSATISKTVAGPAIVVAFLFSGFVSLLSALCYAELGVRFPRAGSAYSYTYMSLGELWGFVVGWNVILEHIITAAAVARACSSYIDSLAGGIIKNGTISAVGSIDLPYISEYLDFLALGIFVVLTIFLSFGVHMTSSLNNLFSVLNLTAILVILGVGAYFSDFHNWTNPETGGFAPYGASGILTASASCFYAYIGFDSIAASGEEVVNPQTSIPRATMFSMGIATAAYVGVSAVLTMMVNYKDIKDESGLPEALAFHGAHWAKYIVIGGALCGMVTALIGGMFALTRLVYAMADDGLLFPLCAKVNARTKIPLCAMYIFAFLAGIMILTLNLQELLEVMSIGTLFAYMIVSTSVIVLRYTPLYGTKVDIREMFFVSNEDPQKCPMVDIGGMVKCRFQTFRWLLKWEPGKLVSVCVFLFVILTLLICGIVKEFISDIADGSWGAILALTVLILLDVTVFCFIYLHEQSTAPLCYKVPLVPLVPALSIAFNALLLVNLKSATWIRLVVWMAVGLIIYFCYGIKHSKLNITVTGPRSPPFKPPGELWRATSLRPPPDTHTEQDSSPGIPLTKIHNGKS